MVGCPAFVMATGQPVMPGGNVEATLPLIAAELPPTYMPPLAPTFPPLAARLLGGLVAVVSVAELKLPVVMLPPKLSGCGLQPVPVANNPPGAFAVCGV